MQSFILCAGKATRLAPLSYILPKPLMPIFQKPLVQHIMDRHFEAGVKDFMVNICPLEEMWGRDFPKDSYRDCPVYFSKEEQSLDSGGGIKRILPRIKMDEPLIVQNGDIFTDLPVNELLATHQRLGKKVTLALRSIDGNKNVGFDPNSGLVTDIRHALRVDAGTHQFAGVYIMDPSIAEMFPTDSDIFSIVPLWVELIRQGEVAGAVFDWVNWYEIGTPEQYLDCIINMASSQRIHPSASIAPSAFIGEDCMIGKKASIHPDAVLNDCIVWPRTHVEAGEYTRCILTPRIKVQC